MSDVAECGKVERRWVARMARWRGAPVGVGAAGQPRPPYATRRPPPRHQESD